MAVAEKLQDLVRQLSEDSSRLVRAEIELAKAEVQEKVRALAKAAIFGGVAAVIALLGAFALVQGLIFTVATLLPTWASALIVAAVLLAVAGIVGMMAAKRAKQGAPPVPEKAIAEARAVPETLREARS